MSDYHTDEPEEAICPDLKPFNDTVKGSHSR